MADNVQVFLNHPFADLEPRGQVASVVAVGSGSDDLDELEDARDTFGFFTDTTETR